MASASTTVPTDIRVYDTLDEFDRNLPDTVRLLRGNNGSRVYVVGTSHFSLASQRDVSVVMQNVRPDRLVLELCPLRLHVLHFDEERLLRESAELRVDKGRAMDIYRQHGLLGGAFYMRFLKVNASVTRQLGVAPGGECRRGMAEAQRLGSGKCQVMLGDRSIYVTMQRALRSLTLLEKIQMAMVHGWLSTNSNITAADVELLKKGTAAGVPTSHESGGGHLLRHTKPSMFDDKTAAMPRAIYDAFVHERDLLLCHSLHYAANEVDRHGGGGFVPGPPVNVVGIVGIGHSAGIVNNWSQRLSSEQLVELLSLPAERLSHRMLRKTISVAIVGLSGYAVYRTYEALRRPAPGDGRGDK